MENEIGPLLNDIAKALAKDKAYPLDGTFLYVEADWGWVDISIFKDRGDDLLWRDPMKGLNTILFKLWEAGSPDKRWSSMQYRISGEKFDASFTYDPLDPNISTLNRRSSVIQQHYGNKPVVYPPIT